MSEMSDTFKLVNAMKLAKTAQVGLELTYFDVIELLGELESLKLYIAELEAAHVVWLAEAANEMNRLNARIAELEAAQRWIPVSERLPEEDTDGNTLMAICRHSGEWVRAPFGAEFADEFVRHYTHWMYAPQPPEVQE